MFEALTVKEKPAEKATKDGEKYSVSTVKIYQSALNQLGKATGIETVDDLMKKKNHKAVVKYVDELQGDYHKKRVVYSSVFYALGFQPEKKISTLYEGFKKYKVPDPGQKKPE